MDDAEAGFVMDAVEFIAEHGHRFLPLYAFDPETGAWSHREYREQHAPFSLDAALGAGGCDETALPAETRARLYEACLREARAWAERLGEPAGSAQQPEAVSFGELQFFNVG
jgi:hypothetical protein